MAFDSYPPPLNPEQLQKLKTVALDYAYAHGLLMKDMKLPSLNVVHAPVSLFPSPFPKNCFEEAVALQPLYNTLVEKMANDSQFISGSLEQVTKVDEFTRELFEIFLKTKDLSGRQTIRLGIHRSDYMLHQQSIKQVELNTISSSFSSLSTVVSDVHRYLCLKTEFFNSPNLPTPDIKLEQLPLNGSLESVPKGIAKAWELYPFKPAITLMIIQPEEGNIFDQRMIEYLLLQKYHVKMERATLLQVLEHGQLKGDKRQLFYKGQEVAVVYFRAGYTPRDYPSQKGWEARLLLEQSFAIKCPCIEYHLVGTKKIQQILANPNIVERFLPLAEHSKRVRASFTGLFPLDGSPQGLEALELGLKNPQDYVMKPQREGGEKGNNIYGLDVKHSLQKLSPEERNAYILMQLIQPPPLKNAMLRKGELVESDVISELGIFGLWLSDGDVVYLNEPAGHLLRTKTSGSNEGGVAAGFGVIDSPFLI